MFADRVCVFLSTGFGMSAIYARLHARAAMIRDRQSAFRGTGAGLIGTLEAAALAALGLRFEGWGGSVALVVLTLLGVYVTGRAEKVLGNKDDSRIVFDEIIGYFWSIAFIPFELLTSTVQGAALAAAFVLFRIFDVYKIPSRRAQDLGDGWGVMMDDVLSGMAVSAILNAAIRLFVL